MERLQGRCLVGEVTIDLALVQEAARTPDKTPLQAVVHWIPLQRGFDPRILFVDLSFRVPPTAELYADAWTRSELQPLEPTMDGSLVSASRLVWVTTV